MDRIVNGNALLKAAPIADMVTKTTGDDGLSYGLSEVGYDIRCKQRIVFHPPNPVRYAELSQEQGNYPDAYYNELLLRNFFGYTQVFHDNGSITENTGRTALASSVEKFQLPNWLWGELRNKSSLARQFIDATIGTDAEPGWHGYLTIEIIFHGNKSVELSAGGAIAKAVFHPVTEPVEYKGKYQNQADKPIPAILDWKDNHE